MSVFAMLFGLILLELLKGRLQKQRKLLEIKKLPVSYSVGNGLLFPDFGLENVATFF